MKCIHTPGTKEESVRRKLKARNEDNVVFFFFHATELKTDFQSAADICHNTLQSPLIISVISF